VQVLLDATYAERAPYSGTAIYIAEVTEALSRLDEIQLEPVVNPRRGAPAGGGLGSVRNLLADRWWTSVELPRLAGKARADLIHHPLPAFARWTSIPQVVTVHDLAFERLPNAFDARFRRYAKAMHGGAARAAAAVIAVSESTALEARVLWGVDPERVVVALHGPGQQLEIARQNPTHFLYVGDDEPRENLGTLLAAYGSYRRRAANPYELVLAGSVTATGEGVRAERSPDPQRLAELYGSSVALVHPSLYEGFGLTALEAMDVGVPVLASDIRALRETCGGAALYESPEDAGRFALAMERLATQPRLREDLTERGHRRASQFSWERSAQAHLEAYRLALTATPQLARRPRSRD
jgi:glycosyltransferase involved in cell wall biosynthesis